MLLYHGSSVGDIHVLLPHISEHHEPYVYFSSNPVVAAFYMVHLVEKPLSWFPYGFNKQGVPEYTEYYPDALRDAYSGRKGFLYECSQVPNVENPTNINCAYVCREPVTVDRCVIFGDVYERLMAYQDCGELAVRKYVDLSDKEIVFARNYLMNLVAEHRLLEKPNSSMSRLIMLHFPDVWEAATQLNP